MSSTDDRIVRMEFDNKNFMKAAADTQKALDETNKAVDGAGKSKGLLDLNSQMETVGVTASKMAIITTTALATITNKVVNTGLSLAKSLTFDPIKQGFLEYESLLTKQNVIMNATGRSAKDVKGFLNELNEYSDKTIYSFSNMTDSITKFVNAGVPLPRAVVSIQGIANAAAYAGATTQEANRAMYAFSQSMQTGFIMLNDWMQIENANMGTQQFKQSLIDAGVAAGTLVKEGNHWVTQSGKYISTTKGWREGLKEQWATTEVLNMALGEYADRNSELGKKAFKAAQDVRTFTAFMDTLKESLASGWSAVFTSLIGNLKQATKFWTGFSNAVGGAVKGFFEFIATALKTWRQMGGFEKTLQGFKNLLAPFAALLGAIGDAWSAAFPSSDSGAGKALYGLSYGFELLTRPLAWLAKGIPVITPLLTGLFMAFKVGGKAIGAAVGFIVDFVKSAVDLAEMDMPNVGGFMGFLQSVAAVAMAAVDAIDDLIDKGKSLGSSLAGIELPGLSLPSLPSFGGADKAADAAESSASGLGNAMSVLSDMAVKMGEIFQNLWDNALAFFEKVDMQDVVVAFNQAIFATMAINFIRVMNSISQALKAFANIKLGVADVLNSTSNALNSFQTQARAKLILNTAIALGILAVSLWLLSRIPADKLIKATIALWAINKIMTKSLEEFADTMNRLDGEKIGLKTLAFSVALLALAGAMILLATALVIMNYVDWSSLIKGVAVMFVMIKLLERLGDLGEHAAKNLVAGAFAIGATAAAMLLLAGALLLFKLVDWGSMAKAGVALAGITLAVGALALIPYEGIAKVGLALLAASAGLLLMANALILFGLVKWESIGKAGVVLLLLTLSLAALMAVAQPVSVAMFLALAASMLYLSFALLNLNKVDWSSIGKMAVVMVAFLAAVAIGAAILAAFLWVVAPLTPVLLLLAAAFALLGLGLLAFAAAMTIAVSLAAAGTAAFAALATGAAVAIAVFLQTLALQAPVMKDSILAILQAFIDTVVEATPMIIQGIKDLWDAIMKELQNGKKKKSFGEIATEWFEKIRDVIIAWIPRISSLGVTVIIGLLTAMSDNANRFAALGVDIVVKFMQGIAERQSRLVGAAVDMLIELGNGLNENLWRLTEAGIDLIADFLHELADAIRGGSSKIGAGIKDVYDAFREVGKNMMEGLMQGIRDLTPPAFDLMAGVAGGLVGTANQVLHIKSPSRVFMDIGKFLVLGLTKGIQDHAASSIVAVSSMLTGSIAMANEMVSEYIQKLDQQALAARAKAEGLARAAEKAQKAADQTKGKEDDKAAKKLTRQAEKAAKKADEAEKRAAAEEEAQDRREEFKNATFEERAKIRAEDAQRQIEAAKQAEKNAAAALAEADALDKQSKAQGLTDKQRKAMREEADRLRKQAKADAELANKRLKQGRDAAADALKWQKLAGKEAAKIYQEQFDAEAKAAEDAEEFEKLTAEEKAQIRREEAVKLQEQAEKNLAHAKELALTDLEAANELAQLALEQAERARQLMNEAEGYESGGPSGQIVDLNLSDAAALAMADYADLYDSAYAAAAASPSIEFKQYNSSPESLTPAEIYRQTNNLLKFAEEKINNAA